MFVRATVKSVRSQMELPAVIVINPRLLIVGLPTCRMS
jgi:hypothetical protein